MKRVVVLGAGFGGIEVAKKLSKKFELVVIDRSNHFTFQPLLYQVATAALSPSNIANPIRCILSRRPNTEVVMAEVLGVDPKEKKVIYAGGEVSYDYLVVATGATHSYFGNDQWAADAPGLKSIFDATYLRSKILSSFEHAEVEREEAVRRALMTFCIVGAGPTGVEIAGALAELTRHTLRRDFDHIDPASASIYLIEAGPRVLSSFSPSLSEYAKNALEKMKVNVMVNHMVTGVDAEGVLIGKERIRSRNVIWCAGVQASPVADWLGVPAGPNARVPVDANCRVPQYPDIYVIGDAALFPTDNGRGLPGVAPVAMQMGKYVAFHIRESDRGFPSIAGFKYKDKGNLATIGRTKAVMEIGKIKMTGFSAWMVWVFVHILYIAGFRNRTIIFIEWVWFYVSWRSGARLILPQSSP
ncbi:MAG: NAD(P)/FAD-dependent oxidoreductase [Fimbriimonadaceae bacterium]